MLAAGIILFAVTEVTTCSTYEICTMCEGYGFTPAEEQCLVCKGAGKTLATTTMYSISLLYPVCMTVLGMYAMILRFALQEVIEKLEFVELRSIDEVSDHKNK